MTETDKPFTNIEEILTYLLAGGSIKHEDIERVVYLKGGSLVARTGGYEAPTHFGFFKPSSWHRYPEPNWYDDIPPQGVLCWVSSFAESRRTTQAIIKAIRDEGFLSSEGHCWKFATPQTKEEAENLIYKAPL